MFCLLLDAFELITSSGFISAGGYMPGVDCHYDITIAIHIERMF